MHHFTWSMPPVRDRVFVGISAPVISRRRFLETVAAGAVTLAVSAPRAAQAAGTPPETERAGDGAPAAAAMSGAEYVALLGGPERPESALPTVNIYADTRTRWVEVASGPLADAIDRGVLRVCAECLFLSYAACPCHVCAELALMTPDDVALLLDDCTEDGVVSLDQLADCLADWRRARALDLIDGPETAFPCAQALYAWRGARADRG